MVSHSRQPTVYMPYRAYEVKEGIPHYVSSSMCLNREPLYESANRSSGLELSLHYMDGQSSE